MKLIKIDNIEWVCELPEGYEHDGKGHSFKRDKVGFVGINKHGKPRWFRAKRTYSSGKVGRDHDNYWFEEGTYDLEMFE